jgi:hypothetical protein
MLEINLIHPEDAILNYLECVPLQMKHFGNRVSKCSQQAKRHGQLLVLGSFLPKNIQSATLTTNGMSKRNTINISTFVYRSLFILLDIVAKNNSATGRNFFDFSFLSESHSIFPMAVKALTTDCRHH